MRKTGGRSSSFVGKMLSKKRTNVRIFPKKWQKYLAKRGDYGIIGARKSNGVIAKGGGFLKNYAKAILYAYPLLATVEEDYESHIKNKALLSYDNGKSAVEIATYLAGEILEMRRLEWLKGKVAEVLARLTDVERTLVEIRYFGKTKRLKCLLQKQKGTQPLRKPFLTERTYFRRQQRLGEKLCGLFTLYGLTEDRFLTEFLPMEIFRKIYSGVEAGKDRKIRSNEQRWFGI